MTNEEALKEIKYQEDTRSKGIDYQVNNLVVAKIVEALEKQISKKPHISLHGTTDWNTKCRCPVCRHDVFGTHKYCWNCGQALDWGESE